MNITSRSNMDDIQAFAKEHMFQIRDVGVVGQHRMFIIRNMRIAEDVSVDLSGVYAFFIGYSQAKSRYF